MVRGDTAVMLAFVVLCGVYSPSWCFSVVKEDDELCATAGDDDELVATEDVTAGEAELVSTEEAIPGSPYWDVTYGKCDTTCGTGKKALKPGTAVTCMKFAWGYKNLDDKECAHLKTKPHTSEPCEETAGCQWEMTGSVSTYAAGCGFGEAVCGELTTHKVVGKEMCEKQLGSLNPFSETSETKFLKDHGIAKNKCTGYELNKICVANIHSHEAINTVMTDVRELVEACGSADVIVISTQEVGQGYFESTSSYTFPLSDLGSNKYPLASFVQVANCGGGTSGAGVIVLARESRQTLFASSLKTCASNKQGVSLEIGTVAGTLVAVSSHAEKGKPKMSGLSAKVADAFSGKATTLEDSLKDTRVAWGGSFDFILAPTIDDFGKLQNLGLTPTDNQTSHTDPHPDNNRPEGYNFNPNGYYEKLVAQPEEFGGKPGADFHAGFQAAGLAEVEGVKSFCPPGAKVQVSGGGSRHAAVAWAAGMKAWATGGEAAENMWVPNVACSTDGAKPAYYETDKVMDDKEKSILGWTDRLVTTTNQECKPVQKLASKMGDTRHDVIFSICTAANGR